MARKPNDAKPNRWATVILFLVGLVSCSAVYMVVSVLLRPTDASSVLPSGNLALIEGDDGGNGYSHGEVKGGCCRGIDSLELWGSAVKWGTDFKFNSSEECCKACKTMCSGNDGPCLCDTWVFCGNREACGSKFGECWLKKQKDTLKPERQEAGNKIMWTSGIIFGGGEGIVGMETECGTLHIKLLPECAPNSVAYIFELLGLRHCAGCHFYRAEGRGQSWNSVGNHIKNASFGPPFALIQGILEAQGTSFNNIRMEVCPTIRRGSVAWVDSGPEFFISLANHQEWKKSYTVFGYVLPEDMDTAEKIARLPTKPNVWNSINVSVLEKPVPLWFRRIKRSHIDLHTNASIV